MKLTQQLFSILFILSSLNVYSLSNSTEYSLNGQGGKPNIIFILTDDQRWDALGYAGNEIIQTPQMDQLAREGTYFSRAIVTTPICSASRASIFSGVHERTHRYTFQTGPISDRFMMSSYPKLLGEAGYKTAFFGKFGVNYDRQEELFDIIENYDRNNSFSDYRGYYYKTLNGDTVHLTRYTGQKALEYIDNVPEGENFCLSLSFSAPHAHDRAEKQYFWQEETDQLYRNMEMPGPELAEDKFFNKLPEQVRNGFNRTRWYWRFDTPKKYQHSVKGYYRMIRGIDLEIEKIRKKLEVKGIADNTIIILMGDNGYFLGERQLAGKWLMYDNSIRVPLIIYDPRVKKHRDVDELVLNLDIPSTILDIAGLEQPKQWQGKSLYPLVNGKEKQLSRDTILVEHLWEFENIPPSEGVRTSKWKYFRYINNKAQEELYDLDRDPQEINNLADNKKYIATLEAMRTKCDELAQRFSDPLTKTPSQLRVEYLRNPDQTKVMDATPEYSWVVPDEAGVQKAYQILVASSLQKLNLNLGDIWDSKQIRSNESVNVEHGGIKLQPYKNYYWKVRIWDRDNRVSDYSKSQVFLTGDFQERVTSGGVFRKEEILPVLVKKTGNIDYFIDFGKAAFGTLKLNYTTDRVDTLTIRLGEKLEKGRIDRNPGGTIRYQSVVLPVFPETTEYIVELTADERNTGEKAIHLPDSFGVIMPFRYCEITGPSNLTKNNIRQIAYFHFFDYDQSYFSSSDTILNQIWELCKYSIKATSFAGIYIDGDRERIPYEADAYINQLSHYTTDAEYSMTKRTLEYFMDHPTWPTEWLLHTAMIAYQDYYYTGDIEVFSAYYDAIKKKTLIDLAREDGLISTRTAKLDHQFIRSLGFSDTSVNLRDIVDWPAGNIRFGQDSPMQRGERDGYQMLPVNTVVNCFFYYNMVIMSEIANKLGIQEDKAKFEWMAAKVKRSINSKLFDHEKGIYLDGEGATHSSLHANMMPLAFGIVPEKYKNSVIEFIKSRGMACSVYGAQYLLEALYMAGEDQYALELMTATHDRSWWNMIAVGSTITLEAWDIKYKPNLDWNHAWGAAPANIIPRWLWGIRPQTPGFERIIVQPQMADLTKSSLIYPTIKGGISCKFDKINARLSRYSIELPANMIGEMILKDVGESIVTHNGKTVIPEFGSIRLEPGINNIVIRLNSF